VKDIGALSREELAALVHETLAKHKVESVLVGGSVVAIYSEGKYVSDDLDFVVDAELKKIRPFFEKLGFIFTNQTAEHPATNLYVQFLLGPPSPSGSSALAAISRLCV